MSVLSRWKQRRAIRRGLLASARGRLSRRQTKANVQAVKTRKAQVAAADRVIARHQTVNGVSSVGVALIKEFEGFPNGGKPYRDPVGIWTIGYGHIEGITARSKQISQQQASDLLGHDLDKKYAPFVSALKLPLNQNQYDALVSFVYNVGPGGIASTTQVGKALRAHDWTAAANHLLDWDKAGGSRLPGLTRRRQAERALFLKAVD